MHHVLTRPEDTTMVLFNQNCKFIVTLKHVPLLRTFTCIDLRVSLLNAESLKEIEQVVFAYCNLN